MTCLMCYITLLSVTVLLRVAFCLRCLRFVYVPFVLFTCCVIYLVSCGAWFVDIAVPRPITISLISKNCHLTRSRNMPIYLGEGQSHCNLLLYLTIKHDFLNFGGGSTGCPSGCGPYLCPTTTATCHNHHLGNCHLGYTECFTFVATKAIWTSQGAGVMTKKFEISNVWNKSFFVFWSLWRTLTSTLILLGKEYRIDVITYL